MFNYEPAVNVYFALVVYTICAYHIIPVTRIFKTYVEFLSCRHFPFKLIAERNNYVCIYKWFLGIYAPITIQVYQLSVIVLQVVENYSGDISIVTCEEAVLRLDLR